MTATHTNPPGSCLAHAKWIWPEQLGEQDNQYLEVRHTFQIDDIQSVLLYISADTNYAIWVNNRFVDSGQFHDYPDAKTYDTLDIACYLQPGMNVIALVVYYQGVSSSQYIHGHPGVIYAVSAGGVHISSGSGVLWRRSRMYRSGPMSRLTAQLGYTWEADGTGDDGWKTLGYAPGDDWQPILASDCRPASDRPLSARPLPKLVIGEPIETHIVAQGVFLRRTEDDNVARVMQADYLSARAPRDVFGSSPLSLPASPGIRLPASLAEGHDGLYVVVDLGREEVGYLQLEMDAADGALIDVSWGEHLDDLRVRACVGGRHFATRYRCRTGRQKYTHPLNRIACRYLQLHISQLTGDLTLYYAGLLPTEYPIQPAARPLLADALHQRIYDTSVRTLHLCMHEHYEDCPWREQSLYAMDMRNQALAGYYCFKEFRFPWVSLDLLARGLKSDGFLELCAPAEVPITIPAFTFAWVLAVGDLFQHSADQRVADHFYPSVRTIMDKHVHAAGSGLLPLAQGPRYWHFYDWADGLDGYMRADGSITLPAPGERHDAPLNLFFILALDTAAQLAEVSHDLESAHRYRRCATRLRRLTHQTFCGEDGVYLTYTGMDHRCELVQALAILAGVAPDETARRLHKKLADGDQTLVPTTLSYCYYKFEALLTDAASYRTAVFEHIERDWGYMLLQGATSFWETLNGASDFDNAGSLCHGWSGIPVYFYHRYGIE